ncbi:MAG TPA: cyclic nucleotide-binding domain-containing protein [Solirubrobacteraceae bacterium]|jgi:uncharacterized protein YhbP (UPF0306 family)|nr:cyclic nucleotide-binding domain-containing protein [Solirubrobacteraceae bacterium]
MSSGEAAVEMLPEVLDYLGEQRTLALATASPSGVPHAGTFLYVHDGPELYFWTKAHTTTARHIEQNPLVAFTIDGPSDDLQKIRGLQGTGECRVILSGEQIARVADLFGQKFPALSPGTTMTISFFRIVASELQFTDNTEAAIHQQEGTFGVDFHRERAYSVFADLPLQSVSSLTGELQILDFPAGETIARAGGPADKFFIVMDGAVEVDREGVGGEAPVSLGPGQFFGELAILRDRPRTATLKALEPTRVLAMERDTFRDIVAESLGTTKDFDAIVRERLRSLD